MNFIESVSFFFTIKNLFFLSVLEKKKFQPSRTRLQLLILFVLLIFGTLFWIGYFEHHPKGETDQSAIPQLSTFGLFVCQILVWIFTGFYRKKESKLFLEIVRIDKILVKYGSLEDIYRKFFYTSITIVLPVIYNILLSVWVWDMFFAQMNESLLNAIISFGAVTIFYLSMFIYAFAFYLDVKLLRDRFRVIKGLAKTCNTMEAYEELEFAHKSLILLMDAVNESLGVKMGFVLISNFLGSVISSYNIFLALIRPPKNHLVIYYDLCGQLVPNMSMLFLSFISGEWITIDVS